MALEKVRELAISGYSANKVELINIPTDQAIRELRIDVFMGDASGDWDDANELGNDPFNYCFQYIELLFDGDKQWKIDSFGKLQTISLLYTGMKAEVSAIEDENATDSDYVRMSFKLPIAWTADLGVKIPAIRFQYSNYSAVDTTTLMRFMYVHTKDVSDFRRFKMQSVPQTTASGGTLQFIPDNEAVVRGAFIFNKDTSITFNDGEIGREHV